MSRILFTTIGSLGDLHPLIALAFKLRERGHFVAFCTSSFYRAKIEALGFEFHPLRPDISPDTPEMERWSREIMDPAKGPHVLLRKFLFPHVRETWEDLSRAVSADGGFDLLISGEIVYAAPVVAEKTGIRWASTTLSPMPFFSAHDFPILAPAQGFSIFLRGRRLAARRTIMWLIKRFTRSWSKPVRQLRAELGLPPGADPIHEGKFSPDLVLAMFSPRFGPPQPDWPPRTKTPGFAFYDAPQSGPLEALERFIAAGEPPIVFTLGSAAVRDPGNFYLESARAAVLLKRRAILLAGQNAFSEALPDGVAVFDYLPYSKIFPRAAAIVHQAGIGTTAQALRAGRPMLAVPFAFDQPDNAFRLVQLGVARSIPRHKYSTKTAARALNELLTNPAYQKKASELSAVIQHEDGAASAADALERLLANRPKPRQ